MYAPSPRDRFCRATREAYDRIGDQAITRVRRVNVATRDRIR
jgi:hypothetical protein